MALARAPETHDELAEFEFSLRYPGRGKRPKGDATVRGYRSTIARFLRFLDGAEPTHNAVVRFIASLEDAGNAPRSIGRHIYALRSFFDWKGVQLDIGTPAYRRSLPQPPLQREWDALLQMAQAPLNRDGASDAARRHAVFLTAALMVYGGAGLRLFEGCWIRRTDIDPRGYLTVRGKGNAENRIPVEDPVITALQDQLATHDSEWVFPGSKTHIASRTMQKHLAALAARCNIKRTRFIHSLRHFRGTTLREHGMDIRDIQDLLRHRDVTSTQIYTQLASERLRRRLPKTLVDHRQRRLGV